jgi:hypothetical protein
VLLKDAQIPGGRSPWPLNFVRLRVVFVDLDYGAYNIEMAARRFGKFVNPWC